MIKKLAALSFCFLLGACVHPLFAATLRCDGVLGNSGEQGATLVRFGEKQASGIGVVVDPLGSVWDRAGDGVLNRYALDGRLLASYKIPGGPSGHLALVGDLVVVQVGTGLYSLALNAPSGTSATALKIAAEHMSSTAREGWLAVSKDAEVFLVNPLAGQKKSLATLEKSPELGLEFGPDGGVYFARAGKLFRGTPEGGALVGPIPGERFQFIDGHWFGHGHHSTIRRFDSSLQAAPGVVMGGNSGSFIGHVDEQAELVNGRGLAKASPNLFAVSGAGGIVHLIEWQASDVRFAPLRRIGAVPACDALALDRTGRIWFKSGNWNWDDGPATPLHFGIPEPEKVSALAMMESDVVVGFGGMWGKPSVLFGRLDKEVKISRIESSDSLPKDAVAAVILERSRKPILLLLDKQGKLSGLNISDEGKFQSEAGSVEIKLSAPVKEWTSLASMGGDKLLGAGDGYAIELVRDGINWKEAKRWNSWGDSPGQKFGAKIFVAVSDGRIWVSDTARHRVVCLSQDKNELLGAFGEADKSGDDLAHVSAPQVITARGSRAVFFDGGNQRVVKLLLLK